MARLARLRRKRERRSKGRKRQLGLWRRTGKRGHRRLAGKHGRAMRFLKRLIAVEESRQVNVISGVVGSPNVAYREHTPYVVTGHYTAGPFDRSDEHAIQLCKAYDASHRAQGWRMIGYHYCVTRAGSIICLRPVGQVGAHVLDHNTGNVGVMFHGTVGDTWTEAQRRAYIWLLENAHTARFRPAHRSPVKLRGLPRKGHNDWMATSCPGAFKPMILNPWGVKP